MKRAGAWIKLHVARSDSHFSRTARRIWPSMTAVVAVFVVVFVLSEAHDEVRGSDFWSVAVPGVLTGFGTLALAGVTVWLALGERTRDDQLRARQHQELADERRSEREAAFTARAAELADEAQRQAFCIIATCGVRTEQATVAGMGDSRIAEVTVVNGSSAPILNVELQTALASGTEQYGPLSFRVDEDSLVASSNRRTAIVLAGDSTSFDGAWFRDQGNEQIRANEAQFITGEQVDAVISWTDVRGLAWKRVGYTDPVRLA